MKKFAALLIMLSMGLFTVGSIGCGPGEQTDDVPPIEDAPNGAPYDEEAPPLEGEEPAPLDQDFDQDFDQDLDQDQDVDLEVPDFPEDDQ